MRKKECFEISIDGEQKNKVCGFIFVMTTH